MKKRDEKAIQRLRVEFLPEALEIVEKPAAPLGNAIIWMVFILMFLFLIWACAGKIDEVAIARGQIMSDEGVQEIQSAGNGVVEEIRVEEGDTVNKGDVLYILNKEMEKKNIEYSEGEIGLTELRVELLDALLAGKDISEYRKGNYSRDQMAVIEYMISLDESNGLSIKEYEAAVENAENQYILTEGGLTGIKKQEEYLNNEAELQKKAESLKSTAELELDMLQDNYKYAKQEADKYKKIYEAGAVSKAEWEAKKNEADNLEKQIEIRKIQVENEKITGSSNANSLSYQISQNQAEYSNQKGNVELQRNNLETAKINLENAKSQRNSRLHEMKEQYMEQLKDYGITVEGQYYEYETREITALYDGVIKTLNVDKAGAVITATQVVAEMLPDAEQLIVEAEVSNADIGYVEAGQAVDVKVDTYDYQKYGTLAGTVAYISPDSIENEKMEQVYKVRIVMDKDGIGNAQRIELAQGMQCTVEIKTDRRRIIDFFLEPLMDALDNSLNVR